MLTVGELIKILSQYDKDLVVISFDGDTFSHVHAEPISDVYGNSEEYLVLE